MQRLATLDRQTKDWALLTAPNNDIFDVCGENWSELVAEAKVIADHYGFSIDVFNPEMPEA